MAKLTRARLCLRLVLPLWLMLLVYQLHHWFRAPFAVWLGWDEAYITAFAERLLHGRSLPYVDAVSHRGPLLYWIAELAEKLGEPLSFAPIRTLALGFAEANVALLCLLGLRFRRPLAGFLAAVLYLFVTGYAMNPLDGLAYNGELAALPFTLGATLLSGFALLPPEASSEKRPYLALFAGLLATAGALCKQTALGHTLVLGLWWLAFAKHTPKEAGKRDYRALGFFALGALVPYAALLLFYVRSGQLRTFLYYFFTYNKTVYLGPVTPTIALQASYLFLRERPGAICLTLLGLGWGLLQLVRWVRKRSFSGLLQAGLDAAPHSVVTLQLLVALVGAISTFRFWDHYFLTALPWMGLLLGLFVDGAIVRSVPGRRGRWIQALVVGFCLVSCTTLNQVTLLWLSVQRVGGLMQEPAQDPIARYVQEHSAPSDSLFVWGFAPELYTAARRKAATRYVYTTFASGLVPWFDGLTLEQENGFAVPGARATLLRDLQKSKPPVLLDVPNSLRGRSMRRYPELASYLDTHYCYETSLSGYNGRTAHIYHRRLDPSPCPNEPPPAEPPSGRP